MPVRVLQRHAGLAHPAQPAQRHHPRPGPVIPGQPGLQFGEQLLPPGQEHRPRRQPQRPARRRAGRPLLSLSQLGLDPGAQPLDQALQITGLRRSHLAAHLSPEPEHERRPGRILQIRQVHVGNARAQQRYSRNAALSGPAELQMRDRQALRIVLRRLEPVPVPHDQHIQVTRGDILQAAVPHGVAVGQITVERLMPRQPQPIQHRLPFRLQVDDRGGHVDPGHHHPRTRSRCCSRVLCPDPLTAR